MSQQSEHRDSDFPDLEAKLTKLTALPPSEPFLDSLGDELDALQGRRSEKKIVWLRFAPVAAAACVVLTSAHFLQAHFREQSRQASAGSGALSGKAGEPAGAPVINDTLTSLPARAPEPAGQFLPVSGGQFLRGATEGAIVGLEESGRPVREWYLEFENAEHWFDPETQTNLRIFVPDIEIIRVPVETD